MTATKNYRLVVRVTIEAQTPLCIGSGEKSILTDNEVMRDVNGLPYIPGTTLAGVLRKELPQEEADRYFGSQRKGMEHGSELIFSEARMIGKEGVAMDGLQPVCWDDPFYAPYKMLPIRQHVRISHRGVAEKAGKFDEEVVIKGTQFVFEIEQLSSEADLTLLQILMGCMAEKTFRIGGGANKGFGSIRMIDCCYRMYCLTNWDDLKTYFRHSSNLSMPFDGEQLILTIQKQKDEARRYELALEADDFFLFGAGMGNADADVIPVTESSVEWDGFGNPSIISGQTLIPASSIKGAILHRTLYHYNQKKHIFADGKSENELKALAIENAVRNELFGNAPNTRDKQTMRGKVLFSDIILKNTPTKTFNHVRIDRLTGGTVDGALFTESVSYGKGHPLHTEIIVTQQIDLEVMEAFEQALIDLCKGMLPLGGATNRGLGLFQGTLKCNDETIYPTSYPTT